MHQKGGLNSCWKGQTGEFVMNLSKEETGIGFGGVTLKEERRFFTALPAPNPLESASAWPCGIPPSSTWSRSPARQDCHSNHSPSCTAAPTDPRGSPCAPISGSSSSCHKRRRVKSRMVAAACWKSFLLRVCLSKGVTCLNYLTAPWQPNECQGRKGSVT